MSFVDREWIREVQGEFVDLVHEHGDIAIATDQTISSFKDMLDDYDDGVAVWLGLALSQWAYGMLQLNVKERAIKEALIKIEQCKVAKNNKDVLYLQKLIEKLDRSNLKPRKVVKKQQMGYICPWDIGNVYAYEFTGLEAQQSLYSYFVKIENYKFDRNGKLIIPIVYFYNIVTTQISDFCSVINNSIILSQSPKRYEIYPGEYKIYGVALCTRKEKEVFNSKLTFLGNIPDIKPIVDENPSPSCVLISWHELDQYLSRNFREWNVKRQP